MKFTSLLNQQKLRIDAHGHDEAVWDDERYEIHLHKETKRQIEGEIRNVEIIVPLNRNSKYRCISKNAKVKRIPRTLLKEIRIALDNDELRVQFVRELRTILKTYPSDYNDEDKAWDALKKIGAAFGIDFSNELSTVKEISGERNKVRNLYIKDDQVFYKISGYDNKIVIEDLTNDEYDDAIKRKYNIR